MRSFGCSLIVVLALAASALGQAPPAAPDKAAQEKAARENLDLVLRAWEKAMTDLKSFAVVIDRTTIDKSLQTKDDFKGYALFVKATTKEAGSRARIELQKTTNAKIYEKYICTGTFLYEFSPSNNLVRVHDMPQNKQGGQQESFLSFLFGMGADQAKARYDMEYKGSDQHYHYVRIVPKLPQDKGDFAEAQLSLLRTNNLPARMWYLHANKTEITWNFTKPQVDVAIPLTHFDAERETPKDWRMERVRPPVPTSVAPTVRSKP